MEVNIQVLSLGGLLAKGRSREGGHSQELVLHFVVGCVVATGANV